jgi:hypothetical protein
MKRRLVLSLLFQLLTAVRMVAQTDHVSLKKEKQTSFFGNIGGYSDGDVNYSILFDAAGIVCAKDYVVDQFTIQYGIKERVIYGERISDSIAVEISNCCINSMLFFTNITGHHLLTGEQIYVYPFNLTVRKNEE